MSEEASDVPQPAPEPESRRDSGATVLPFPSTRPLDPSPANIEPPRLRDVIGDVLRDERRRQERTLADVADEAAVSLPYLSEVERGRKEVSSDVLDAIGTALDLPLVEILERSAERLRTDSRAVGHRIEMSAVSASVRGQRTICFRLAA